jgi:hypothetical protein
MTWVQWLKRVLGTDVNTCADSGGTSKDFRLYRGSVR